MQLKMWSRLYLNNKSILNCMQTAWIQIRFLHFEHLCIIHIGLELAIDPLPPAPPPPRGNFVHYDFLKLHYITHKIKDVSPMRVVAVCSHKQYRYHAFKSEVLKDSHCETAQFWARYMDMIHPGNGYKENNFELHVISICMPCSQCSLQTITTTTHNMYLCN